MNKSPTKVSEDDSIPSRGPFNTAIESGLRALCLLYEAYPNGYDTQRMVFFDYLIVHSGDVQGGPESLHPATPFRSNEWIVRRRLVDEGLHLLIKKGLVHPEFTENGILFSASETAGAFVACLSQSYTEQLKERAKWVVTTFGQTNEAELNDYFTRQLDRWGAEFEVLGDWDTGDQ